MKIFRYLDDNKGIAEKYRIFKVVQNLKPYAISKYKSWWEDALDEAFFHILENFDSSKGDLENYATRVVGTIFLNKNRKEIANSEKTNIELDLEEAEEYSIPEDVTVYEDNKSNDVGSCVAELVPFFVKDFKFFVSSNTKDRKLNYKRIFEKYTYETIIKAKEYLLFKYNSSMSRLTGFSKLVTMKNFSDDRYLKSLDIGLEYMGVLNDIIIIKRFKGSHAKKLFKLSLEEYISLIINIFYTDENYGKAVIEGTDVYITMSGNIVIGMEALKSSLEKELVGSILSRTALKVVNYEKGYDIIFSSTKDYQYDVILPIFGKDLVVGFERVVAKEVS